MEVEKYLERKQNIHSELATLVNHLDNIIFGMMGGSPGLVVMGGDSCSKGRGFESQHRILDRHFFTFICCKIVMFV